MTEIGSMVRRAAPAAAPPGAEPEPPWDSVLPAWAGTRRWHAALAVKRGLDVVGAAVALVLSSPFLAVAAVLIKLDSRGPVLHRMEWVGLRGRRFTGFKLRTMVADAAQRLDALQHLNEMSGPAFKITQDPRITRVGRLLRRWSIDELPQLWSVLCGDLSLVGPRCPQRHEYAAFTPSQRLKLAVKPGITCIWQVSGRAEIKDFDEWVRLDLDYIRRWSLGLDLVLLLRTVPAVLSGRGAQ